MNTKPGVVVDVVVVAVVDVVVVVVVGKIRSNSPNSLSFSSYK